MTFSSGCLVSPIIGKHKSQIANLVPMVLRGSAVLDASFPSICQQRSTRASVMAVPRESEELSLSDFP